MESISINAHKDRKVLNKEIFEKYSFSSPYYFKNFNQEYLYFISKKNKLVELKENYEVNNLIIQKKNSIKEITDFNEILLPNIESKADFIIVYNSKAFNENDIQILTRTLKKIAPNISYISIDVQEIYNKYSFSNVSASAIKQFLHEVKIEDVLLLGDANEQKDEDNLIPTFYYVQRKDQTRIETDYIYTYDTNPAKPIFSIGRLPFKTSLGLNDYLLKLNRFLERRTKMKYAIYDDINVLKGNMEGVSYKNYEETNLIVKYLNSESLISFLNEENPRTFQYTGHASYTGWSDHEKVEISNFRSLNVGNDFLLLDLSCWTGTFAYHKRNCFSENLLGLKDKGAVSIISSSGYTEISNYENITNFFIENKGEKMGTLLMNMKKSLFRDKKISLDDLHAYNLLGITTLKY